MFSPLIRAPPNATSHPRAACWANKTFSLCTSRRWHEWGRQEEGRGLGERLRGHGARSTAAGPGLSPCCWHLLFSNLLQFHSHCPGPLQGLLRFLSSVLTSSLFLFSGPHSSFLLHGQQCPFFPSHFFLLKARWSYHSNHCHMTPR